MTWQQYLGALVLVLIHLRIAWALIGPAHLQRVTVPVR
ncbi:hypothetical protein SAMN05421872_1105 [Nocardioides lianchengensis]|uniref:Uncharacterized protein n=1 Tax=Nocardioides lianchengensis TaxID=1045774 RepID=A0A1G6WND4_9ACTN|nr:cytochrome b561 [Nocardioides lianchengensis]SDD67289.1 hypothetical protein SAMN05421872_1105 [Nocardioides lianchengensis]